MGNRKYGIYEVLIGMFNNFKIENRRYTHDEEKFHRFFYNNREKYSVLDNLAFDADDIFPTSKELDEAHSDFVSIRFLNLPELNSKINRLNQDLFYISFNKFNKDKFNESELKELEQLSLEFQKEFCNKTNLKSVLER